MMLDGVGIVFVLARLLGEPHEHLAEALKGENAIEFGGRGLGQTVDVDGRELGRRQHAMRDDAVLAAPGDALGVPHVRGARVRGL